MLSTTFYSIALLFGLVFFAGTIESFDPMVPKIPMIRTVCKSTVLDPAESGANKAAFPVFQSLFDWNSQVSKVAQQEQQQEHPHTAVAARGDWRAYLDDGAHDRSSSNTGEVFYYNVLTGQSQWHAPPGFPAVQLTSAEKRKAAALQQPYRQQMVAPASSSSSKAAATTPVSPQLLLQKWIDSLGMSLLSSMDRPKTLGVEGSWKAYADRRHSNAVYYYNSETDQSQWEAPTRTFPAVAATSSAASTASTTTHDLLASHGDWRAYFDADDSCLVYYYNVQTQVSQWNAPAGFPVSAVRLKPSQLTKMKLKRQQVSVWQAATGNTPLDHWNPWGALWEVVAGEWNNKQNTNPNDPQKPDDDEDDKEEKPWWGVLFAGKDAENKQHFGAKGEKEHAEPPFWASLFHHSKANKEDEESLPAEDRRAHKPKENRVASRSQLHYEVRHDFYIPGDEPEEAKPGHLLGQLFHHSRGNSDTSPTRSLHAEPHHRVMSLTEKRLMDSDKRQANLRRNYDAVIVDRSPTVSLTALKKRGGKHKDWFLYVDEE